MDGDDVSTPESTPMGMHLASSQSSPSSRPTLGFPLGTALLLIVVFCLSGVFSCCYHWEKLRSFRARARRSAASTSSSPAHPLPLPPYELASKHENLNEEEEKSLPVIMPGDLIPKFMAWPCPFQPALPLPMLEKITVEVMRSPSISAN